MTTNEIREKFLKFFESKGHTIVDSASVVPTDDPTVLFTTAGMQQFKPQFLGQNLTYRRATTCQKCLRTDDLEKVGKTPVHHTFFEMLGNFSFGDYFKKEAIAWAWEFFTKELRIPADKLWASVYTEDDEAYNIWVNNIKLPKNRILKLGDKDNFWPAEAKEKGPNGPCGPCSEIFFDFGIDAKNPCPKGDNCNPECNCGRFAEIWNLVFTQFNRKEGGVLEPLPGKNIDTGMGLERLVSVIQGKRNNFENDVFSAIIKAIKNEIPNCSDLNAKIIADHIRAVVFGIADGVIPSNEGRGYVIKKLIINSSDIAIGSGKNEAVIYKLVQAVVATMGHAYPEIKSKSGNIAKIIQGVEEAFIKIRKEKIPEFKSRVEQNPQQLGKLMFEYRDTHGLTLGTIVETASEIPGISKTQIDDGIKDYEQLMTGQKDRSRASSKMTGDVFADMNLNLNAVPKTEFLGYKEVKESGKILKIFKGSEEVQKANQGDTVKIILDRTPFYAESGGQIGDTGTISGAQGKARVLDTQKTSDVYLHAVEVIEGSLSAGDKVDLVIDAERRLSIMRNHTATHLLQAALRKTLGSHVQQQGSLVAEDRLRFDFTHPKPLAPEEKNAIENFINTHVAAGNAVSTQELPLEEAKKIGALAFFAEKYGKTVRVVSIGDYSKEFCGGTHVSSTKQIESFRVTNIGAVAQGIRRIEAVTGPKAIEYAREAELKTREKEEGLKNVRQEEELKKNKFESTKAQLDTIIEQAESIHDTKIVIYEFVDLEINFLRTISDLVRQKCKSAAFALGSKINGNASLIVGLSDDLVTKGLKANEIVKQVSPLMNGSGGGRPQLAQAGSKDPEKLSTALQEAAKILKQQIKG